MEPEESKHEASLFACDANMIQELPLGPEGLFELDRSLPMIQILLAE